jgi:hypothetical protein
MELENIILSEVSQAPSYADFRSRANTAMWPDLDHMIRREHNTRGCPHCRGTNTETLSNRGQYEKGIRN